MWPYTTWGGMNHQSCMNGQYQPGSAFTPPPAAFSIIQGYVQDQPPLSQCQNLQIPEGPTYTYKFDSFTYYPGMYISLFTKQPFMHARVQTQTMPINPASTNIIGYIT